MARGERNTTNLFLKFPHQGWGRKNNYQPSNTRTRHRLNKTQSRQKKTRQSSPFGIIQLLTLKPETISAGPRCTQKYFPKTNDHQTKYKNAEAEHPHFLPHPSHSATGQQLATRQSKPCQETQRHEPIHNTKSEEKVHIRPEGNPNPNHLLPRWKANTDYSSKLARGVK